MGQKSEGMWARKGVLEMGDLEVLVGRDSLPHPFPPSLDVTCSPGHIHHNRTAGYPFLSVGRTLEQKHEFELSIPSFLFFLSLLSCSAFFLPARGFPTSCLFPPITFTLPAYPHHLHHKHTDITTNVRLPSLTTLHSQIAILSRLTESLYISFSSSSSLLIQKTRTELS